MEPITIALLFIFTILFAIGTYAVIRYGIIPSVRTIRILWMNDYVRVVRTETSVKMDILTNVIMSLAFMLILVVCAHALVSEYVRAFDYVKEHRIEYSQDTELQDPEQRNPEVIEEEVVQTEEEIEASKRANFIEEWKPRLNRYLAGSPLSGYGETFAAAAYDYDVDPRYSAAISCVESGKGSHCFKSHNAWGWGGSSWSTWEEAIYAHTKGLANSYGHTVTESAAKKYCPPNWSSWYYQVRDEMGRI